ncbi:lipoprotein insertase outer membrane protein LolB [Pasteurella skyensis]|uniref:Outer-membrane lipoprotein LolB n=1 Tax=Phocoenobacter skyensis TaxID=97481 RepID=A0AAJ6P322_9PAST|nr:lipoprotein insertase outer membrane protein LolB [Pasteurella skyensis]MDP8170982.1 lipoprotein insertase outer membrane protein LolB [Pasteurella skyensis]MDP8175308.1 lipoprotein insertase outer membrane protein LolB [Pasteurella skyensis]
MNINSVLKLSLITAMALLSGCSSILNAPTQVEKGITVPHNDSQWQAHLKQLEKIKHYQADGQFGYISKQPKERFSSSFKWHYQNPQHFSFILSSSLSNQSLTLKRSSQGLTILDNKGNQHTESDINKLMIQTVGVAFPIDQFGDWLKGLPTENTDYVVNQKRQLSQFRYPLKGQVWVVSYVSYDENQQPHLPKLIILENGNQTLKIRIDNWKN